MKMFTEATRRIVQIAVAINIIKETPSHLTPQEFAYNLQRVIFPKITTETVCSTQATTDVAPVSKDLHYKKSEPSPHISNRKRTYNVKNSKRRVLKGWSSNSVSSANNNTSESGESTNNNKKLKLNNTAAKLAKNKKLTQRQKIVKKTVKQSNKKTHKEVSVQCDIEPSVECTVVHESKSDILRNSKGQKCNLQSGISIFDTADLSEYRSSHLMHSDSTAFLPLTSKLANIEEEQLDMPYNDFGVLDYFPQNSVLDYSNESCLHKSHEITNIHKNSKCADIHTRRNKKPTLHKFPSMEFSNFCTDVFPNKVENASVHRLDVAKQKYLSDKEKVLEGCRSLQPSFKYSTSSKINSNSILSLTERYHQDSNYSYPVEENRENRNLSDKENIDYDKTNYTDILESLRSERIKYLSQTGENKHKYAPKCKNGKGFEDTCIKFSTSQCQELLNNMIQTIEYSLIGAQHGIHPQWTSLNQDVQVMVSGFHQNIPGKDIYNICMDFITQVLILLGQYNYGRSNDQMPVTNIWWTILREVKRQLVCLCTTPFLWCSSGDILVRTLISAALDTSQRNGRYAEVDNRSTDITLTVVEILEKVIIYAQTLLDAQTHEENVLTNEDEPLSHRSDKDKSFIDTALFVLESGVPPGMSQYLEHILASNMRLFQSDSLNQPKDPQPQGETINGNTCDLGKRIQDALNTLAPMVSSGPQCRYDTSRLAKETGLSSPINISNPVKSFKCQNEPSITCYMSRTKDIRMKLMHWAQLLQTNCLPHLEKTFPMLYLHVSDIVHIVNQI